MLKGPRTLSGLPSGGIMAADAPAEKNVPLLVAPVDFLRVTWIGMDRSWVYLLTNPCGQGPVTRLLTWLQTHFHP